MSSTASHSPYPQGIRPGTITPSTVIDYQLQSPNIEAVEKERQEAQDLLAILNKEILQ
jgi:hypothetical protein